MLASRESKQPILNCRNPRSPVGRYSFGVVALAAAAVVVVTVVTTVKETAERGECLKNKTLPDLYQSKNSREKYREEEEERSRQKENGMKISRQLRKQIDSFY